MKQVVFMVLEEITMMMQHMEGYSISSDRIGALQGLAIDIETEQKLLHTITGDGRTGPAGVILRIHRVPQERFRAGHCIDIGRGADLPGKQKAFFNGGFEAAFRICQKT